MSIVNNFSWKVAGEAGHGILNAGLMFAKTCLRGGLFVFATAEYPSLIRGGHNNLDVRVSETELHAHTRFTDLLVALDKNSIDKHEVKISEGGGIIYDGESMKVTPDYFKRNDIKTYNVPLMNIANENGGKIMRNVVAMGATIALLDFDIELFYGVLKDNFGTKKGMEVAEANIKAAKAGYDYIKQNFPSDFKYKLVKKPYHNDKLFLSGNEAISTGAIKAGCKFIAAYPMTPATSVFTNIAAQEKNYNIIVKHTEDEISAINMAIGAGYAGLRAMTATSGGGFALMCEGFGLAGQTETPIVVVEAMRPGPATGMATHTGQGDLRYILHASTDEFPRLIIAPGSVDECYYLTQEAFNFAEKYQMPVMILTDKYLGESYRSVAEFDTNKVKVERGKMVTDGEADYKRYKLTEDAISPRSIPGIKNGMHVASSYEHDEHGHEREEEEIRIAMHNKRYKKFALAEQEVKAKFAPELLGSKNAGFTIIAWGSTKGPVLEAMKLLEKDGISTNFLPITFVNPMHDEIISDVMKNAKRTIIIEGNMTAQFAGLIREKTGLTFDHKILKYDGRPFAPEHIADAIKELHNDNSLTEIQVSTPGIVSKANGVVHKVLTDAPSACQDNSKEKLMIIE
ncbi:MAG: 2-oxoacid:acceptor oxidoreductase subunit alpha [Candidatus Aenigmarchaeota archaeon]|nr:2-oxoacid:acceptor oxidoreductase subunit alpha [Candidatus Aenigmarchaeota archaeon]